MNSINILFYSNYCEGSKQLLAMFNTEKLTRFFHLICTDNNPKVPQHITITPTIIISDVPIPYVASDAFAWLAKVKQWKMTSMMQNMNTAQQQYLQNINNNLVPTEKTSILGFSSAEMNGMSDIFSFFSKNVAQECQDSLPQSYFTCSNMGQEYIFTPPLEDGSYKVKDNGKYKVPMAKQKEMQNKLEEERNKQDKLFIQNIANFRKQYDVKQ